MLGALGTLLLSAAPRLASPPSPVCDEAGRVRRRLAAVRRRRRTETRLDAQGRPRAVAACGNCGGGPAENRGQHMRSQQERERACSRGWLRCPRQSRCCKSVWPTRCSSLSRRRSVSEMSGLGRSVWQRARRALQVVSLRSWSEASSSSHRPVRCASEVARDVAGAGPE